MAATAFSAPLTAKEKAEAAKRKAEKVYSPDADDASPILGSLAVGGAIGAVVENGAHVSPHINPVPEPAPFAALAIGAVGLLVRRRRQRR